jgi:hypothetical protein
MAGWVTDVNPPIIVAAGTRQALSAPKTINHTMQPETAPAPAPEDDFMSPPWN